MAASEDSGGAILHVIVVGFHHKKGCQVEYSYPPLVEGQPVDSHEIPEEWKHLPSLALPDGAHNYEQDTIYFHLPARNQPNETLFGVSCYRQMDAKDLINKGADVTRETVQKSVCVLSKLPLYGLIQAKLELITHAYFDERDFSKVALLEDTFKNLNSSLDSCMLGNMQAFLGLSSRELVLRFKHKVLVLFKLILLEKKVMFFMSPVKSLCSTILSLLSLFPGMIEHGLKEAAIFTSSKDSPESDTLSQNNFHEQFIVSPRDVSIESIESLESEKKHLLDLTSSEKMEKELNGRNVDSRESSPTEEEDSTPSQDSDSDTQRLCKNTNKTLIELDRFSRSKMTLEDSSKDIPLPTDEQKGILLTPGRGRPIVRVNSQDSGSDTKSVNISLTHSEREALGLEEDKLLAEIDDLLDAKEKLELSRSKLEFREKDSKSETSVDIESIDSDTKLKIHDEGGGLVNRSDSKSSLSSSGSTGGVSRMATLKTKLTSAFSIERRGGKYVEKVVNGKEVELKVSDESLYEIIPSECENLISNLTADESGFPLSIYIQGTLCHPYLSLPFLDTLSDPNVRGYVIGATNILFKQKKQLSDVLVEVEEAKIDIHDNDLKKQLHLTTEDLRFADNLVRIVSNRKDDDEFLDGTGWEGNSDWVRSEFSRYLKSLLNTVLLDDDGRASEAFNNSFVNAWKATRNYKIWKSRIHPGMQDLDFGHPYQGQLSVADMKLRFSHTMQSTEQGRKLNQAMSQTGKAVIQTSKVVGGALNHAKSAMSSWFSNLTNQ